jgi:hypothetical protein
MVPDSIPAPAGTLASSWSKNCNSIKIKLFLAYPALF